MTYLPLYRGQLSSGDPYGGVNCTAWTASYAIDFATSGGLQPTGTTIRKLSNEPRPDPDSPGLNLAQVDRVGTTRFGVDTDVRYRYPWSEFVARINAGEGAHLQVWYGPIADSPFDGGRGFRSNHDLFVPPGWGVYDPLADGRAPGVYRFRGDKYPLTLLRTAAGKLNIGGEMYRALGAGLVYAGFVTQTPIAWHVSIRAGTYGVYTVVNGAITPGGARTATTGGFSANCTAPRLYPWAGHTSQSLVLLTSGSHKGQYVRSTWARKGVA